MRQLEGHAGRFVANGMGVSTDNGGGDGSYVVRVEGLGRGAAGTVGRGVVPVRVKGGLGEATNLTVDLRENHGIFCSIVVYPVVPKDTIMLRLIPTAVHTLEDVDYTIKTFSSVQAKLDAGEYKSDKIASWG